MKIPIYIDTDMGVDDVIAICMLVASGKYDIRAVSLVNGVSTIKQGIKNANRILTYLGISCPIYAGANQRDQKSNVQFPARDRKRANNCTLLSDITLPAFGLNPVLLFSNLKSKLAAEKQTIEIFAIGPLTNIKTMLTYKKQIINKIKSLIIMGGAVFTQGNVSPYYKTEYNVRLDINAAKDVLTSSLMKLIIPIDATVLTPAVVQLNNTSNIYLNNFIQWLKIYTPTSPTGKIIREIILNNTTDFNSFYDPLAAAVFIDPTIINSSLYNAISVSINKRTFGTLILLENNSINTIVLSVKPDKFYTVLKKLIR